MKTFLKILTIALSTVVVAASVFGIYFLWLFWPNYATPPDILAGTYVVDSSFEKKPEVEKDLISVFGSEDVIVKLSAITSLDINKDNALSIIPNTRRVEIFVDGNAVPLRVSSAYVDSHDVIRVELFFSTGVVDIRFSCAHSDIDKYISASYGNQTFAFAKFVRQGKA